MKQKLILMSFLVLSIPLARSQSISPMVIGSTGMYLNSGTNSVEFTVGELAVTTLNSPGNLITQGFHQTYTGSSYINENEVTFSIQAYPNPTIDELNITINGDISVEFNVDVYDSYGRKVLNVYTSSESKLKLSLAELAAGTYFISLVNAMNNQPIKTLRIQKLSNQ